MLSARAVLVLLALPAALAAQGRAPAPWDLRLRATISGTSYDSEPANYKVYSGISLEGAVGRRLGALAAVELSARTESREVVGPELAGTDSRLGSLEMLPVTLLVRWLPRGHSSAALQPYVGAGGGLTLTWERSGALDSTDEPLSVYPALGLGADYGLSDRLFLNLDVTWHPQTTRINDFRTPAPKVKIDPMTFGLGMGVRL